MAQNHQSHLCCHLDNTSPRLTFTSTSTAASGCSIPRIEELVPVSPCSCPPRGPQLFHSQVNFTLKNVLAKARSTFTRKSAHSQDRACKCAFDFYLKVTSPLNNMLANALVTFTQKSTSPFKNVLVKALLTFTHKSTHSQDHACKCTFGFHSKVTSPLKNVLANAMVTFTRNSLHCYLHPIQEGLPLWHAFLLWHSHPALVTMILPSGATHPAAQDAHCGLGFALWCSICSDTATCPIGQGDTLLYPILFVVQVPAQ